MTIETALCEHLTSCRYEDLPPEIVLAAKNSILDTLGVILAATTHSHDCQEIAALARDIGGKPESSVLGFGDRVPAMMAALVNGSLAHLLDFDDTHEGAKTHPTSVTLPAALAIAQHKGGVTGRELLTAVAVASDVVIRLGMAIDLGPTEHGWLGTAVYGYLGGAAAAGKILGLSPAQMGNALGIAFAQAGGSREIASGCSLRGIRDGFSQKTGVLSAQLAQRGITGPARFLEGKSGLYNLYFKGKYSTERLTADLGRRFEGSRISYKIWPSCRLSHTYLESLFRILDEHKLFTDDVESVEVVVSTWGKSLCEPPEQRLNPDNADTAKDSIPFTLGIALAHREVGIKHYMQAALTDPNTLAAARKVRYRFEPSLNPAAMSPGDVRVTTRHGTVFHKVVTSVYGSPENPIRQADLEAKFRDCVTHCVTPVASDAVENVISRVRDLENLPSVDMIVV